MVLFDFTLFGHNYGIGVTFDWTLLVHALVYGGTVVLIASLHQTVHLNSIIPEPFIASKVAGLLASLTASLYLELLQMWQFHWKTATGDPVGMFGIADFAVSCGAAFGVYFILKNSKH